jgi:multidrug resistance efflux pump
MSRHKELIDRLSNHSVTDDAAQWDAANTIAALEAEATLLGASLTSMQAQIHGLEAMLVDGEAEIARLKAALTHSRRAVSNAIELFGVHKDDPAHATLAMIDAALSGQPGESE